MAALALALTFSLEKGWLTVALALMVPGIAWIANERPLPMLRWLAAARGGAGAGAGRLGAAHRRREVGTTPIFNWILYGYGVPAISFWIAGYLLRKRADDKPCRMVDSAAILFTVLSAFLEIRHFMNGGDIYRQTSALGELALQVCTGLAMTIGLEHVRHAPAASCTTSARWLIAALTFAGIVFGLWLFCNPLLTGEPVGSSFSISSCWATAFRRCWPLFWRCEHVTFAAGLSHLRRCCRGAADAELPLAGGAHPVSRPGVRPRADHDAEQYTYSVVWLAYGVALLLFGIALRSQPARLASAAITLLTVAKVFLFDMAG